MQTMVSQESFLEFSLVYKNVCLNILRQRLQKLETVNFDEIISNLHILSIFTNLDNYFRKHFGQSFAPKFPEHAGMI